MVSKNKIVLGQKRCKKFEIVKTPQYYELKFNGKEKHIVRDGVLDAAFETIETDPVRAEFAFDKALKTREESKGAPSKKEQKEFINSMIQQMGIKGKAKKKFMDELAKEQPGTVIDKEEGTSEDIATQMKKFESQAKQDATKKENEDETTSKEKVS